MQTNSKNKRVIDVSEVIEIYEIRPKKCVCQEYIEFEGAIITVNKTSLTQ